MSDEPGEGAVCDSIASMPVQVPGSRSKEGDGLDNGIVQQYHDPPSHSMALYVPAPTFETSGAGK